MYGFKAIVFDGKKTARKALDTLEDYSPVYSWIDDVALISRSKFGGTKVHSTWAQDNRTGADTGFGAVTGGLVGMLLGPAGALAGAGIGGSLGALMGASEDITFDDPRLDEFAEAMVDDTSALILVGEVVTLDDFTSAVEPYGGKIISTDLNEKDIKALRKRLKEGYKKAAA